jgi:hypothetical protein
VTHRERDTRGARGAKRRVGLLALALGLVNERVRPAAREPLGQASLETWAWASISPGNSVRPPRSIAPSGAGPVAGSTRAMTPPSSATEAHGAGGRPLPSITRAFQRIIDNKENLNLTPMAGL